MIFHDFLLKDPGFTSNFQLKKTSLGHQNHQPFLIDLNLGKALTSVADSHDSSSLVGFSNNLVVATQIFFIFTPNPWGNDPI